MKRLTDEQSHYYKVLNSDKYTSEQICRKATAYTLTPVPGEPGWDEITYYQDSPFDQNGNPVPTEYVYVLANHSMPGMVKIGMTIRDVNTRANEISGTTGVPTPWIPVYSFKCFDAYKLEQELHKYLDAVRVAKNREMFNMHSKDAIDIVNKIGEKYTIAPLNTVTSDFKTENND